MPTEPEAFARYFETARELITSSMGGFGPELILCGTVIVLLLHDLFVREARPKRVAWVAVAGLVMSGIVLLLHEPGSAVANSNELFGWWDGDVHKGMLADDKFGAFFKMFVLAGTLVTIPMCFAFPDFARRRMGEFYALLVAATIGMFLMASATNLLMIYMGIEFASMASYLAVAFLKRDRRGSEAGLKYVIYGSVASGIMIYGISLLYGMTGSLHLSDIAASYSMSEAASPGLAVGGVLVFAGFAYKMAAFPMHFWCPDVYEGAPVPFTAYLSVTSKAAGFAVFIRFLMSFGSGFDFTLPSAAEGLEPVTVNFGWRGLVAGAAALSMTAGNLAALWQTNVKRMLAYSSIAHAGYLLMGVAVLAPQLDDGGRQFAPLLFYFVAYFFMNLGAFYVVTLVAARTGSETIDSYRGLGSRSIFLSLCLGLCLISLLGIPPTGGFTGKLQLFMLVIDGGMVWLAVVAGINTAVSAYYYFRLIKVMYLDDAEDPSPISFSPLSLVIMALLALPILILGLAFNPVAEFTRQFGL